MKVADITSRTIKVYRVRIDDGEIRQQPHTTSGRQYRVGWITVEKRDGNVHWVSLAGSVLKKDGTDSRNEATEYLYGQRDWPEWLHSIVGGLA